MSSSFIEHLEEPSGLRFKVDALATECELLRKHNADQNARFEAQLAAKTDECNRLSATVKYVNDEKEQLAQKCTNQAQIHQTQVDSLTQTIADQKKALLASSRSYAELDSLHNRTVRKYEHVKTDLNYQLKVNDELTSQIKSLNDAVTRLQQSNDDLVAKLGATHSSLSASLKLQSNLQLKNAMLQKTNNELQLKMDRMLQHKTSVELLKQKNISLSSKVAQMERFQEKCYELEIANIQMKEKYAFFDDGPSVSEFVDRFKQTECELDVVRRKLGETTADLLALELKVKHLETELTTTREELATAVEDVRVKLAAIEKLERTQVLNSKEIEYLREELTKQPSNESTNQYLTNLEKLVDEYKTEITKLKTTTTEPPSKRPRIVDVQREGNNRYLESDIQRYQKLHEENIALSAQIKLLEGKLHDEQKRVIMAEEVREKRTNLQLLQMKANPVAGHQALRQQMVDALHSENQALIEKYVKGKAVDSVPHAVFERQEADKEVMQTKIDQLSKRILRLRQVYAQKSKDILAIMSKYFGFVIEFLPSATNPEDILSRIKLTLRFEEGSYLVIDTELKSLKAYGRYEFKALFESVLQRYTHEQIPLFLSAFNLELYKGREKEGN